MKKTSTKIILSVVAALVLGYVLGIWISFPNLKGDNLKGDIGKASKFSQKATADEIKAAEERLQNDSNYYNSVMTTLSLVDERINIFANLVSMTTSVCEGVDGLQPVLAQVQGLQGMVSNAQGACNDALAAVSAISKGEEADYEQTLNNLSLAYAMVSRSSKVAKNVVKTFDHVIGSKPTDNSEMAFVRDEWVRFSATEAALQGDEIALDYWGNQNTLLTNDQTLNLLLEGKDFMGRRIIIRNGGKEEDQQCLNGEEHLFTLTAPISCAFLLNVSEQERMGSVSMLEDMEKLSGFRCPKSKILKDMERLTSSQEFSAAIANNLKRLNGIIIPEVQEIKAFERFIPILLSGDFRTLLGGGEWSLEPPSPKPPRWDSMPR